MPLEIRELHIKVSVNEAQPGGTSAPAAAGEAGGDKASLIQAAVEQVMEIINSKNER